MTTLQKIIKYCAIALAAIIIVSIISATAIGIKGLALITSIGDSTTANLHNIGLENADIATLDINVKVTNLKIQQGDILKAETNSDNIECSQNDKKLDIYEKEEKHFKNRNGETLIIYIPENLSFEKVNIKIGAGKVNIDSISAKYIDFDLGAGKVEIEKLNAIESAKIETGAGKLQISSGDIKDLNLDMGAGDVNVSGNIIGNNKIDAGVGNLSMKLNGSKEDYKIKANKGIGPIKIGDKQASNGETIGNGDNVIDISGGIGNVNIKFE